MIHRSAIGLFWQWLAAALPRRHLQTGLSAILLKFASVGAGMLASIIVARFLGPSDFGIYAIVFAGVAVLTMPVQLGVPALVVRETARSQALGDWSRIGAVWRWAGLAVTGLSVLICATGLMLIWLASPVLPPEWRATLLVGLLLVPLSALGEVRGAALRGLRHPVLGALPERVIRPLGLVALATGAMLLGGEAALTPSGVMGLHAVAAAIAFATGGIILLVLQPKDVRMAARLPDPPVGAWLRDVIPFALAAGLQVLNTNVGLLLLGAIQTPAEAGHFKVVTTAASLVAFGLPVFEAVAAPHVARLHALGDVDRLQRLARIGAWSATLLSVPVFIVLLVWGRELLTIFYGAAFAAAYLPLLIIMGGQLINSATGPSLILLGMSGHPADGVRVLGASVVLNAALTLLLAPLWGATGAAIALACSATIISLVLARQVRRRLGIGCTILGLPLRRQ